MCQPLALRGKVLNEAGEPVPAVTISVKGLKTVTGQPQTTNHKQQTALPDGSFTISNLQLGDTILFTASGYQPYTEIFDRSLDGRFVTIVLKTRLSSLDEVQVIAYGTTTRRLATGSISRITADDIARQPVYNPIAAMQALVPGLLIAQRTGLPGSEFNIQLRGDNSLKQGTRPLFIIDGVPFTTASASFSQQNADIQSIFNTINPSDIQSIEVLKDADATAIYGSQGANGVVLITTKKGTAGTTRFRLDVQTGFSRVGRLVPVLKTPEYLAMRRQAFSNDGRAITVATAPDLLVWDTTAYTDWQKVLLGGTARTAGYVAALSGGGATVSYRLGGSHTAQSTVFPGAVPVTRTGASFTISFTSPDRRLSLSASGSHAVDKKELPFTDLTAYATTLPPNAPPMFDSAGGLKWTTGIDNPMAYLLETYRSAMGSTIGNLSLRFSPVEGLTLGLGLGYNSLTLDEEKQTPIAAQRPSAAAVGSLRITGANNQSWLAEPQLTCKRAFGPHGLELLLGASFQQRRQAMLSVQGSGYTSDDLLASLAGAATVTVSNSASLYKYAAGFGRLTWHLHKRYILNLNIRRDGSSRYGPLARFATFGAGGGAWNFADEPAIVKALPFLSFGKLRGSWGISGNDQVGDYQYFDAWTTSSAYNYNGAPGILPARLFNDVYQWEKVTKLEGALELGFFANRLLLTVARYRNRSSAQLVSHRLPTQTGFTTLLRNIDAVVENSGTEIELTVKPFTGQGFSWQSSFNLSLPRNRLLRYPGLENSTDRFVFAIGYPLDLERGYHFTGVDEATGVYTFRDIDGDGRISSPADLTHIAFVGSTAFGGWQNTVSAGPWQLSFLIYGNKQWGRTALAGSTAPAGFMRNGPRWVLDAWTRPGDKAEIQQYTTLITTAAGQAFTRYRTSSALVADASFIRLRNSSLSYTLPQKGLSKARMQAARLYIEAQNLFTITGYRGPDPETQSLVALPPLRVIVAGIQLTF
jgi:TonB-linked SusC/RagA family outer membrane protein